MECKGSAGWFRSGVLLRAGGELAPDAVLGRAIHADAILREPTDSCCARRQGWKVNRSLNPRTQQAGDESPPGGARPNGAIEILGQCGHALLEERDMALNVATQTEWYFRQRPPFENKHLKYVVSAGSQVF